MYFNIYVDRVHHHIFADDRIDANELVAAFNEALDAIDKMVMIKFEPYPRGNTADYLQKLSAAGKTGKAKNDFNQWNYRPRHRYLPF